MRPHGSSSAVSGPRRHSPVSAHRRAEQNGPISGRFSGLASACSAGGSLLSVMRTPPGRGFSRTAQQNPSPGRRPLQAPKQLLGAIHFSVDARRISRSLFGPAPVVSAWTLNGLGSSVPKVVPFVLPCKWRTYTFDEYSSNGAACGASQSARRSGAKGKP